MVAHGVRWCPKHTTQHHRDDADRRGNFRQRGYSSRWDRAAKAYLGRSENGLCAECARHGRVTFANCVDHIQPWQSGTTLAEQQRLMWSESNWQPLCDRRSPWNCHGVKTAREDGAFGRARVGTARVHASGGAEQGQTVKS